MTSGSGSSSEPERGLILRRCPVACQLGTPRIADLWALFVIHGAALHVAGEGACVAAGSNLVCAIINYSPGEQNGHLRSSDHSAGKRIRCHRQIANCLCADRFFVYLPMSWGFSLNPVARVDFCWLRGSSIVGPMRSTESSGQVCLAEVGAITIVHDTWQPDRSALIEVRGIAAGSGELQTSVT